MDTLVYSNLSLKEIAKKCDASVTVQPHQHKTQKTLSLLACFVSLGICSNIMGGTLVHMKYLLNTDIATIAMVFTWCRLGYIAGSVACGFIYNRINSELLLFLSGLGLGVATFCMPWTLNIYCFFAITVLQGFARGLLDTGAQPYIISLWIGHRFQDSIMQAMHAAGSIGNALGPLLAAPFLIPIPNNDASLESDVENNTMLANSTETMIIDQDELAMVRYSFYLSGIITVITSLSFLAIFVRLYDQPTECYDKIKVSSKTKEKKWKSSKVTYLLVILNFLMFVALVSYEAIPTGLLSAFAIEGLGWNVHYGAWLASLFWISITIGRLLSIPLAMFLAPTQLLSINIIFTTTGFFLMCLCPVWDRSRGFLQ